METGNLPLMEGEQLVFQLEADMWKLGTNPITKIIGKALKWIAKILGFKIKGLISVTNKRVMVSAETINCYVFKTETGTRVLNPSSILEVGYSRKTACGLFCPTNYFYYQGHTDLVEIEVAGASEEQMKEYVNKFYSALLS